MRKFLALAPADRRLLAEAAFWVLAIRLGLWVLPFRVLRLLPASCGRAGGRREPSPSFINRINWAVNTSSRCVPAATCLTKALATQILLGRHGHAACLRIGVARGSEGGLVAHAWVEVKGQIVVGDIPDLSRYTCLPPLGGGGA